MDEIINETIDTPDTDISESISVSDEVEEMPEDIPEDLPENTDSNDIDEDVYHAIPNSEIPILQEDGSVMSLADTQEALEAEEADDIPEDVYHAVPNSEIPILQEDGSVMSLADMQEASEAEDTIDISEDTDDSDSIEEESDSDLVSANLPEDASEEAQMEVDDTAPYAIAGNDLPEDTNEDEPEAEAESSADIPMEISEDVPEVDNTSKDEIADIDSDEGEVSSTADLADADQTADEMIDTMQIDVPEEDDGLSGLEVSNDQAEEEAETAAMADDTIETGSDPLGDIIQEKTDEIMSNDSLSTASKIEALKYMRDELENMENQGGEQGSIAEFDGEEDVDEGPVLALRRDEQELLDAGARDIDRILEAKADDYRDKGLDENEIAQQIEDDRREMEQQFLQDAFPGRDVQFDHSQSEASDDHDITKLSDVTEWIGDINPNFDAFDPESPYSNNCGSCALAVYKRLEGSTDSCASAENIGYNSEMEALTGMEQVSMSPDEIQRRLLEQGDGAHAIIGIDRAEGPGHWFNAACVDGKVVAIDGQTGEIMDWPPDYGDVVNWEMSVKKGDK